MHAAPGTEPGQENLARRLLRWYDRHGRSLPWRAGKGVRANPYHVWLSEIMLQQTTVATVGPYFHAFLARWPTVDALATANLDEVLHAWQGLGYYARARNLHRCARQIVSEFGGQFPESVEQLKTLPGVGPYTAAAVAAIAYDIKAAPVDGNVERVMARLFAVPEPLPEAKPTLRRLAESLTPDRRTGDYAQAVMDLGATVCTPRRPLCERCPWRQACQARAHDLVGALPRRRAKKPRPLRHGVVFWVVNEAGAVLLRRRPEQGLLGGMMEVPSTAWRDATWRRGEALKAAPVEVAQWCEIPGNVAHGFTHFRLRLRLMAAEVGDRPSADGIWCGIDELGQQALPTLTKKVIRHALEQGAGPSFIRSARGDKGSRGIE